MPKAVKVAVLSAGFAVRKNHYSVGSPPATALSIVFEAKGVETAATGACSFRRSEKLHTLVCWPSPQGGVVVG